MNIKERAEYLKSSIGDKIGMAAKDDNGEYVKYYISLLEVCNFVLNGNTTLQDEIVTLVHNRMVELDDMFRDERLSFDEYSEASRDIYQFGITSMKEING